MAGQENSDNSDTYIIDPDKLQKVFDISARFIDITLISSTVNSITLKDGVARDITSGRNIGVGIRVLENTWGFASSTRVNDIGDILDIVKKTQKIAKNGKRIKFNSKDAVEDRVRTESKIDPADVDIKEKMEMLHTAEAATGDFNEVVSTSFSYADSTQDIYYQNMEGTRIESRYNKISIYTSVFAKKDGRIQVGMERLGGTGGFEIIKDTEELAIEASKKAIRLLDAGDAPSGNFRVVLDPKLTGVFIHEALGHAAEADHIIQGESILQGKLGEKIASDIVTVYDDPTLKGSFGFYHYDSEGIKGKKTSIIKDGILKTYLHSRETSSVLDMGGAGNARAQGFNYQPVVRMSNTYLEPGKSSFEEMIEDIKEGVYLRGSKGGEVDPARGVFQFSAEEGFLIKGGEIKEQVRDVAMSGETLRILKDIDMVGDDFDVHIGYCGKASQLVPVGDGGPHIRTYATVGGTG